ncbi:globin [Paenibacillus sp. N1-5-1-14]|uniref:globin domain-containing protein n=1 Tax=Paenibacillus radicibacter TaxID=2972488 RepID=UPI0021594A07|nr:globin [Paenibacillus radicibacter]MCR8645324.1 globin [Paenibacillus radicibacter]
MSEQDQKVTIYDWIGGEETLRQIVEAFYPKVQLDPLLSPLFPEDILPIMEKQHLFLTQFLGGPSLYSDQYGHPMMRARHMPFPITPAHAAAWLSCMEQALVEVGLSAEMREVVIQRLSAPAYHFVNTHESN